MFASAWARRFGDCEQARERAPQQLHVNHNLLLEVEGPVPRPTASSRGLELHVGDTAQIFQTCLERRDFSGHPWWAPFAQTPASAELIWRDGHSDVGGSAPVALALTAGEHCVWVVAAQPVDSDASSMSRGGYLLGMDEVIVTGERHFAESIGIASER